MTKFFLDPSNYEKWAHQNRAEPTGDYIEGCLLDNFVVFTKHGIAAVYEHYVNPNQSDYLIHFTRERNEPGWTKPVLKKWYEFEERIGI